MVFLESPHITYVRVDTSSLRHVTFVVVTLIDVFVVIDDKINLFGSLIYIFLQLSLGEVVGHYKPHLPPALLVIHVCFITIQKCAFKKKKKKKVQ